MVCGKLGVSGHPVVLPVVQALKLGSEVVQLLSMVAYHVREIVKMVHLATLVSHVHLLVRSALTHMNIPRCI